MALNMVEVSRILPGAYVCVKKIFTKDFTRGVLPCKYQAKELLMKVVDLCTLLAGSTAWEGRTKSLEST